MIKTSDKMYKQIFDTSKEGNDKALEFNFAADNNLKYFSYFSPENNLWHFMQIVSIGQFAWNVKAYFLVKIRKIHLVSCQFVVCWVCPQHG